MTKPKLLLHRLLTWYDVHQRTLPWRAVAHVSKGSATHDGSPNTPNSPSRPNPYHVWLSEIMLQQTTVATVIPYFRLFTHKWPSVVDLARAKKEDILWAWQGLGYYSRAHRLHEAAQHIDQKLAGMFPSTYEGLLALPGVGPYTAAAVGAIAFNLPLPVVDGNVERLMGRLYALRLPKAKLHRRVLELLADFPLEDSSRPSTPGDLAQAMMDFANQICLRGAPLCEQCPLSDICLANEQGCQQSIPQKVDKTKPTRRAVFFLITKSESTHDEDKKQPCLALYRRPNTGLLPGMMCLPSTPWHPLSSNREDATLEDLGSTLEPSFGLLGSIRHTFTHFHLEAALVACDHLSIAGKTSAGLGEAWQKLERWTRGHDDPLQNTESSHSLSSPITENAFELPVTVEALEWCPITDLSKQALPTLVRKLLKLAL